MTIAVVCMIDFARVNAIGRRGILNFRSNIELVDKEKYETFVMLDFERHTVCICTRAGGRTVRVWGSK